MTRAIIDQDITPTSRLTEQLPDAWNVIEGIDIEQPALGATIETADIAFVTSRVPLSRKVIQSAPELDVIAKLGTGIDSIDIEAAAECGVTVTHTPGHNALSVAEHTVGLTLATLRRLTEARRLIECDAWRDEYSLGSRLFGSTIGIVGFGNVGKRVGTLLSGFDVDLLAHDPYVHDIDSELVGASMVSLEDLLEQSDVVMLTTELTDETCGMIGKRELDCMKPSAVLINTARGPVVRNGALVDALRSGSIAGAGLDVFAEEPVDSTAEWLEFDNVVATPHISAMTLESRREGIDRLATNTKRLLAGRPVNERYVATSP
ncbi:NAD(P)-dependent oxidoreductase [Halosolutus gelatinilyticus]|uniref:NAD(P)-dependent oxidoreductase n=1 Tax=Halosolutus gelatinilyticus TaxID=2931975 RepID=UPI001FF58AFD|nr:NAD(P)-dependent oxidoreductase [Halosolutus gelatinilyticus]